MHTMRQWQDFVQSLFHPGHSNHLMRFPLEKTEHMLVEERVRRWLHTAILGLNLCPFAHAPVKANRLRYAITAARTPDEVQDELNDEAHLLSNTDSAKVETTLLILPHALGDFLDFNFFLAQGNALLKRLALEGVLQLASFHPAYEFSGSEVNDIGNYTNRSPYPILHLLREDSVSRAVDAMADPDVIVANNLKTLRRLGHAGWASLWDPQD